MDLDCNVLVKLTRISKFYLWLDNNSVGQADGAGALGDRQRARAHQRILKKT